MTVVVDVDLRNKLGEARNQGERPTCLAFAASAAHEVSRDRSDYLSTEFLFFTAVKETHRDRNRGLTTTAVSKALRDNGQPLETAWPYQANIPDGMPWKPPDGCTPLYKAN